MEDSIIGPAIPSHLLSKRNKEQEEEEQDKDLLSSNKKSRNDEGNESADLKQSDHSKPEMGSLYGPVLPDTLNQCREVSYGPALPPDMMDGSRPETPQDDSDDEVIGPLPGGLSSDHVHRLANEIDARSKSMRNKLTNKDDPKKPRREEWMMELPPETQVKGVGLGPRKFKTKYTEVGDRSVWTRMPGEAPKAVDTSKKASEDDDNFIQVVRSRQIAKEIEDYNKTYRSESLVDMHKKKKALDGQSQETERRPFDRDTDLIVPSKIITTSKRTNLIKDSQKSLDTKFSRGKNSFL